MSFLKYRVFWFLFFITCFYSNAQESGLYFEHVNYDEGFSQGLISSIKQSDKGFIWIGTENGLFKYDGYSYYRYTRDRNKEGSLSNNHINVIFEDSDNNLWIGTNNGVNLFRKNTNDFLAVDVAPIKGGRNYITSFIEDNNKTVWVGTFGGVKRINKESYLLENISSDSNYILNQSRVLSLFYDESYGVLVGTSQGIKCFNPENGEQKELPEVFYKTPTFLKAKIWKTVKEVNGDLWFATETMGAFFYSKANNKLTQYVNDFNDDTTISSNWVNDIISINENTLWFGTKDGLSIFEKDRGEFTRYKHNPLNNSSLTDNDIKCFLKDRHGSIWLGTIAGGVNFYNKANSNFINIGETIKPNFGLNNSIVNAIVKEKDDVLWVGTYGGGLNFLDFNNRKSNSYKIDFEDEKKTRNLITALVQKDKDNLLCGTFNGLFQFNKNSKKFTHIPLSSNNKDNERPITSLIMDNGNIWVSTDGNGLKKVLKNGVVENYLADGSPNSLSDNFVTDLENRENGLWVATQDGLNYFDKAQKKFTKVYRNEGPNTISNSALTVLFTDSKNRLWIGGDYDGLNYFNEKTETFLTLNKESGLTDATIKSIAEDCQGNLWVSSEDLLFKITINNPSTDLKPSDFEITSYSSKDGVSVKQFSFNSSVNLNRDELVFGATKGLTIFNPEQIIKSPNNSEIVITKLIVNNKLIAPGEDDGILDKPISETSEISLNYDQGYIGLEFSSLNFINPKNSRYSYKLDDSFRNDDWHNVGTQNSLNLTDLNTGSYTLFLRSSNEEGVWNPKIKTFKINILPPWWATWWAYLLYFSLFFTFLVIVIRFINNRVKLKRELFLEHVENERQQELYNMQLNFFTNISHEIRTPLTLINGPVEDLLSSPKNDEKTESKLKTIKHNSDRLLKLVNELLDFRKAEKGHMKIYCEKQDIVAFCFEIFESFKGIAVEKKIEYKFVLNTNSIQVYFDKNQMEKVIYNLLSNAFKFTKKNGKIVFVVEQSSELEGMVYIRIKDNGIGIPESSKTHIFNRFFQVDDRGVQNLGSGVGLALSKSIVELHHGDITIPEDKESWANTVFQISLLLGKKHLTSEQIVKGESEGISSQVIDVENEPAKQVTLEEKPINSNQELDSNKKTVLIVEDNDEVRNYVNSIINEDYNVLEFANGKDALSYMEKEIPDLIISDIMMPEMDGLELCKFVKNNESTNHIPVILLTAKSSTDNRIEGLTIGADSYISKPFSTKVLKLNISNLLKSKEILRNKYSGNFIIDSDLEKLTTPEEIFIKKLMKIIESNIENPDFDVNELVKEIGMSRTILYKKVSTLTNHSVASLIKHIRLKKAADIILNTSYPISEVAFMVGFNDRKHFSREFKKVYNYAPTAYKNSQLQNQK
ncbi:two-component regulator propeller domain-containing protein [Yeosuana marina]|uniref:two-component regulator propeller domain-containing protein n=1 Tax=Yeosuana marina TaxID=1565536 RepID=UPI0030C8969E